MGFLDTLRAGWRDSMLCLGLDPDPARIPARFGGGNAAIKRFCIEMVDAVAEFACAVKPQIAYFAAGGAERALEGVCEHVLTNHPRLALILDAKRNDIGDTARLYAREAFERYGAHAVTVNPYLGTDSIEPFLAYPGRAAIVLCRTSNPGGAEFQADPADPEPLFMRVARRAATDWSKRGEVGLVVGATYPADLAAVRATVGDLPILVPGVGAQGGDVAAAVRAGRDARGAGLVINASRSILYAGNGSTEAARDSARALRDAIRSA